MLKDIGTTGGQPHFQKLTPPPSKKKNNGLSLFLQHVILKKQGRIIRQGTGQTLFGPLHGLNGEIVVNK